MNSRITLHCNEALAKGKQENNPGSQNGTTAAPGIVTDFDTTAPRKILLVDYWLSPQS
jgi:hypothetical protein